MEAWMNFCFIMSTLITPILIAIYHDFDLEYELRVILAPITLAWLLLLPLSWMISRKIDFYH